MSDQCQFILCSATFDASIRKFAEAIVPKPSNSIHLPRQQAATDHIKQFYITCEGDYGKFAGSFFFFFL